MGAMEARLFFIVSMLALALGGSSVRAVDGGAGRRVSTKGKAILRLVTEDTSKDIPGTAT